MKASSLLSFAFALLTIFVAASTVTAVSQSASEKRFRGAGIKWDSTGGCSRRNNPRCTSFEGLREATVQGAITLKKACKCSLTITGGTETGHARSTYSHGNGYKLDFRKAPGINKYVTKNFKRISNLNGYKRYRSPSGNIYMSDLRVCVSYLLFEALATVDAYGYIDLKTCIYEVGFKFAFNMHLKAVGILALLTLGATAQNAVTDCLRAASIPIAATVPTTYNVRVPYQPLAFVSPITVAQISSAVSCGTKHGVSVSAKSGGHSYVSSGFGGTDGHIVINLDRMYAVTVAADGTAKVQAGARLGHVATELFRQGKRAISHGTCPGVGIGGHALQGGHGMVSRKYGLATDWIKGATVVLANGTVTRCSATERPNLFWALRGAGTSMVIVAEIEFNTFVAPEKMTYFDISLVWNQQKAPQVLLNTQEFAKTMPSELTMAVKFNKNGYFINGGFVGDNTTFANAIQPLLAKLGAKISSSKTVGWIEFITHFAGTAEVDITTPNYNEHENFYATSITTPALSKLTFESLVASVAKNGFTTSRTWFMHMNILGGEQSAVTRPKMNATAYAHRDKLLLFQLKDGVPQSQQYPSDGFSLLQGFKQNISSGLASGAWGMYVNYPDSELGGLDAPKLYWGANLRRLEWVKQDYDPRNVFNNPQSIRPAQ
ncbi:6-hydroxy-D-nicotine oxidase 3 [Paramyrothecium foliicola]|nr:6-hydroxy-D-nicotine oxidase 3 [Paramyrothecium foliicola]